MVNYVLLLDRQTHKAPPALSNQWLESVRNCSLSTRTGHLPHFALDELFELIGLVGRRHLERKRHLVRMRHYVRKPEAWPCGLRIAEENDAFTIARNAHNLVDDVSFGIRVEGPELLRGEVGINDHQIIVRDNRPILGGRIFRMILANQNLPIQSHLNGEIPRACSHLATAYSHPFPQKEFQGIPV